MAYGIQNLTQASRPGPARQDVQRLSRMGRGGDDTVAHMTSGEMVIPKSMQTPGIMSLVAGKMRQRGVNPAEYIVGSPHAQANANPYTGAQQFPEPGMGGKAEGGGYGGGGGGNDGYSKDYSYDPSLADYEKAFTELDELDALSGYSKAGKYGGGIVGGILGLASGIPGAGAAGIKGGAKYGPSIAEAIGRQVEGLGWDVGPDSAYSSEPGMVGGQPGSIQDTGFGSRNYGGGTRQRRINDLMRSSVGDDGSEGIGSLPSQYVATAPQDIDYEHYGELSPGQGGGEKLMYPFQLPGGQVSYGQYPMFEGIEGFGPAPRPDGRERDNLRSYWQDRLSAFGAGFGGR